MLAKFHLHTIKNRIVSAVFALSNRLHGSAERVGPTLCLDIRTHSRFRRQRPYSGHERYPNLIGLAQPPGENPVTFEVAASERRLIALRRVDGVGASDCRELILVDS